MEKNKEFVYAIDDTNMMDTTPKKKSGRKPVPQEERVFKRVCVSFTEEEYTRFLKAYKSSCYPSEGSFLKSIAKTNLDQLKIFV